MERLASLGHNGVRYCGNCHRIHKRPKRVFVLAVLIELTSPWLEQQLARVSAKAPKAMIAEDIGYRFEPRDGSPDSSNMAASSSTPTSGSEAFAAAVLNRLIETIALFVGHDEGGET